MGSLGLKSVSIVEWGPTRGSIVMLPLLERGEHGLLTSVINALWLRHGRNAGVIRWRAGVDVNCCGLFRFGLRDFGGEGSV